MSRVHIKIEGWTQGWDFEQKLRRGCAMCIFSQLSSFNPPYKRIQKLNSLRHVCVDTRSTLEVDVVSTTRALISLQLFPY
jgi:hypothetical protein